MVRGDLLLYKSTGKWYERLIVRATRGPYVHVAIVIDNTMVLAARSTGIAYDTMPFDAAVCYSRDDIPLERMPPEIRDAYAVISLAGRCIPSNIECGLSWAIAQVGKEYGWLDIVYQAVKFLYPNNKLQLSLKDHFDCSDFCTRYLQQCGVILPPGFEDTLTVTPNDLYRWSLLPEVRR